MIYYIVLNLDQGEYLTRLKKGKFSQNFGSYSFAKKFERIEDIFYEFGVGITGKHSLIKILEINEILNNNEKIIRKRKLNKLDNIENDFISEINSINILKNLRIDIVDIDETENISIIRYLGIVSNSDIYNIIKKYADEYIIKNNININMINYRYINNKPSEKDINDFLNSIN